MAAFVTKFTASSTEWHMNSFSTRSEIKWNSVCPSVCVVQLVTSDLVVDVGGTLGAHFLYYVDRVAVVTADFLVM